MDTLEPYFGIKYKLTRNTNWEEFLEAVGIDMSQIKGGTRISPVVELSRYQDKITLKTVSVFKNYSVTFKLGEEYEDELPDGQKVKAVTHLEDNKLIQSIPHHTDMLEIVREFGLLEMHATYTFGEFVCTRKYKKQ